MALTGLFLCTFLVGHLAGNLQLLIDPANGAKDQFNLYAHFMTTNPLVKILSYITYASILFHAIDGIVLLRQNKKARAQGYAYNKPSANSKWNSRFMGFLGTVILIFIIVHMNMFWAEMHFGDLQTYMIDGVEVTDLYTLTIQSFQDPSMGLIVCLGYLVSMIVLSFHLIHGFKSAFQSLGMNHPKYNGLIQGVGLVAGIAVPALFAIIPFYIHFNL